jgi:hypothetical protein
VTAAAAPPGNPTGGARTEDGPTATAAHYPPAPPLRVPGPEACPLCGAPLNPDQDWCLRCGAAARTRLAATPNWKGPIAAIAVVAVLALGVLAAALVKLAGGSGSNAAPTTTTTVAAPAASTPVTPTTPAVVPSTATTTPTTPAATTPTATTPSGPATTPSGGVSVPSTTPTVTTPSGAATTTTPGDTGTGGSTTGLNAKERATLEKLLKPGAKKTAAP